MKRTRDTWARADHVPRSMASKTLRACSNGAEVIAQLVAEGMVEPVDDEQQ